MSGELRIEVLGPLRVLRGGTEVELPGRRQRALLAGLLLQVGQPTSVDTLVEVVWGRGSPPASPRGALQTVVSRLRRSLGPDPTIDHEPAGYVLALDEQAVLDVTEFDRLVTAAASASTATVERDLLEQALELWRGLAWEGFEDVARFDGDRARLTEARLAATERLADVQVAAGEVGRAVTLLRAVLDGDPFRESARAGLMLALSHAGRVREALACYHEGRELFQQELGIDPSPRLDELHRRILSRDLGEPAGHDRGSETVVPVPSPSPFVGRSTEADLLGQLVRTAHLITIVGPGGVGKTRLAAESLPDLARDLDRRLVVVECEHLSSPDGLPAAVAVAFEVDPGTSDLLAAMTQRCETSPTLLWLDGAEQVAVPARDLAERLIATSSSIRLVVTSRTPLGSPQEQLVPLAPLPLVPYAADPGAPGDARGAADARADDLVVLFEAAARRARPDVSFPPEVRGSIVDLCHRVGGLPLAIELAGARAATIGLRAVGDGLDRGPGVLDGVAARERRSLGGILEWTAQALTRDARRLVCRLAVAPGPFDLALATALADSDLDGPVEVAFGELGQASLLLGRPGSPGPGHRMLPIVRSFFVGELADDQRGAAESRLVDWAMALVTEAIPRARGPDDRAALDLVTEHRSNLELALRLAQREDQRTAEALAGQAALVTSHRMPLGLCHLARRVGEPTAASQPGPLAIAAAGRAAMLVGDWEAGAELARDAWDRGSDEDDARYLAAHTLAVASTYAGRYDEVVDWCRWFATDADPPAHHADAHATMALVAAWRGELTTAGREAASAREFARASGASAYRAFAAYAGGEVAIRAGDADRASADLRAAARAAVDAGAPFIEALASTALASVLVRNGDSRGAGLLRRVVSYWRDTGGFPQLWTSLRLVAEVCDARDDHETALLLLEAADRAPTAPELVGDDATRDTDLRRRARAGLDPDVVGRVQQLAGVMARSAVVDRALGACAPAGS